MIIIHKSHSKTDLIDLINYLGLNIIFNHSNNKKELHQKMNDFLETTTDSFFQANHFNLDTPGHLKGYLIRANPKKTLSIKEKQDVMGISICPPIIKIPKLSLMTCSISKVMEISRQFDEPAV